MKKLLALILAAMLIMGIVNVGALAETAGEPVTLTIFHAGQGILPSSILDNPIMKQVEEKTGVILDFAPFMGGADANETASRAIAAGDYPDIWLLNSTDIISKLIEFDLVMPLDDLLANAPNVTEIAGDAMNYAKFRFQTEETYLIPLQVGGVNWYPSGFDSIIQYRYDLWKEAGQPALNTYDDLIAFMKTCMEMEPVNKDGLTNYAAGLPLAQETYYVDYVHRNNKGVVDVGWGTLLYDRETGEVSPRYERGSDFYEGAKFWNTLYREGLLDPESATMTLDQVQAKGQSYRYFMGVANWQIGWPNDKVRGDQANIKDKIDAGETLTDWEERINKMGWAPLVISDGSTTVNARGGTPYGNGNYYMISSTCKDPAAAMRFIDYTASWEGAELFSNGVEGHFWITKDGAPYWYSNEDRKAMTDEGFVFMDYKEMGISYVAPLMMVNGIRQNPNGWATLYNQQDASNFAMSNGELEFIADNGYTYSMEYVDAQWTDTTNTASVIWNLVPAFESTSELAVVATDVSTLFNEYVTLLIYAETEEEFEALFDEYVANLYDVGLQDLMDYYLEGFEEAKKTAEEWGF